MNAQARLGRLARLVRVRRARRDGARLARALAEQEAQRRRELARAGDRTLRTGAQRFADEARSGAAGSWWRPAFGGLEALGAAARAARDASRRARAEGEAARARLVEARRELRAAERLAERAERRLRRDSERAQQRRLDEAGRSHRPERRLRRDSERAHQRRLDEAGRSHRPERGPGRAARFTRVGILLLVLVLGAAGRSTADPEAAPDHGIAVLLGEIRGREAELAVRERELRDREQRLAELEAAVTARLSELEALAATVESRIAGWEYAQQDKALSRLARIYGTMPPRTAAGLLEQLELDLATRIVAKMKHKQSAALLPLLSPPRALAMSRNVAHPLGTGLASREDSP